MVAIINTGHSLRRIFHYNENKVNEGEAVCIAAVNYPKDVDKLSTSNKINRLIHQAALNENVTRNSVHVSLNFDASESFSKEKLEAIAITYMEGIGFARQPYLVYQHTDAAHPHIHIVSVKVTDTGERIDMQNIGRNQSEKVRKEIEQTFQLKKASHAEKGKLYELRPVDIERVRYGELPTKRAIQNILTAVIGHYKYSSLPELNAVLSRYNVIADRGKEGSRTFKNNGLLYGIIDEKGQRVGPPIKASAFYNKPTLATLEKQFEENEISKQTHKQIFKNKLDEAFGKVAGKGKDALQIELEKRNIDAVWRTNKDGFAYGITFVDRKSKCVFNGSALGKQYSAKSLQDHLNVSAHLGREAEEPITKLANKQPAENKHVSHQESVLNQTEIAPATVETNAGEAGLQQVIDALLSAEYNSGILPFELKTNGKRKRKKKKNNPRL
jgi:hypothetical protein